jgi:hypothetical protein
LWIYNAKNVVAVMCGYGLIVSTGWQRVLIVEMYGVAPDSTLLSSAHSLQQAKCRNVALVLSFVKIGAARCVHKVHCGAGSTAHIGRPVG